jgi:hypothetical protein
MEVQNATKQCSYDDLDQSIAAILIASPSMTDAELGDRVGLSRQAVNKRRNSASLKRLLNDQYAISTDNIKRLISKSLKTLEECLDSPDERIRLAAALPLIKLIQNDIQLNPKEDAGPRTVVFIRGDSKID